MKTTLALFLVLSYGLYASAASVEFKVFKLNGDIPKQAELARLCECDLLQPVYSGSAHIKKDASFSLIKQTPVKYATDFSDSGVPVKFEEKKLGYAFSGNSVHKGEDYAISFDFSSRTKDCDHIYLHQNGTAMPQPFTRVFACKTSVTLCPKKWFACDAVKAERNAKSDYYVLALRVVK